MWPGAIFTYVQWAVYPLQNRMLIFEWGLPYDWQMTRSTIIFHVGLIALIPSILLVKSHYIPMKSRLIICWLLNHLRSHWIPLNHTESEQKSYQKSIKSPLIPPKIPGFLSTSPPLTSLPWPRSPLRSGPRISWMRTLEYAYRDTYPLVICYTAIENGHL